MDFANFEFAGCKKYYCEHLVPDSGRQTAQNMLSCLFCAVCLNASAAKCSRNIFVSGKGRRTGSSNTFAKYFRRSAA